MQGKIDTEVQTSNISNQGQGQVFQANIDGSKEDLESLDIVNKELTTQASSAPQLSQQPSTSSSGTQETSVSTAESQAPLWFKGKKLDMNWLLLSEQCLNFKIEVKDKWQRPVMSRLLCRK